jgi:hypothetical protein
VQQKGLKKIDQMNLSDWTIQIAMSCGYTQNYVTGTQVSTEFIQYQVSYRNQACYVRVIAIPVDLVLRGFCISSRLGTEVSKSRDNVAYDVLVPRGRTRSEPRKMRHKNAACAGV